MAPAEVGFVLALALVNLGLGIGLAIALGRLLARATGGGGSSHRYVALLLGIYFLECVAFPVGMATQVFSVGLAFVWGVILGLRLRGRADPTRVLKMVVLLSLYTCLPTVSFGVLLPLAWTIDGKSVLSVEAGASFGIPDLVPWPFNTVLGFCFALVLGTVVLKTVIMVGETNLLICLRGSSARQARGIVE